MTTNARYAEDASNQVTTVVVNIAQLCTVHQPELESKGPRRRGDMSELGMVNDAVLALGGDRVVATGPRDEVLTLLFGGPDIPDIPDHITVVNAAGCAVIPGFVDPHTHTVFGKTRQDEYERRIKGETYLEIAAAGGGIHSSVADTRTREEAELAALAVDRLQEMLSWGTTTVEIKSGYGLTLADEVKMLRAAKEAVAQTGIRAVLTCLAAHEIPSEFKDDRAAYVRLITEEILPLVARKKLAERCDVFCEPSVFTLEESVIILSRAKDLGLRLTIHADELEAFGGAVLATRLGADSADHLIRIDQAGRDALRGSKTVAVMLPGTVFTLGLKGYAPAREMIDEGCAVALASDFNPGSCPILSIPLIMAISCTQMRLTPAESLVAATLNAAWALGRQDEVGSLAPGKMADFVILDSSDYRLVPYRAGHNPVASVFLGGQKINA
ncbi:MAG: imidazolonepropionase [Candidatus Krumholzibacteria bacterium]|nr:imidazolonepropionase [Candidatus Krumholzibacteria bacterium]